MDKKKTGIRCSIGGQGLLEGVMMKSPEALAIAVRKKDGSIAIQKDHFVPYSKRHKILGWPIIRGVAAFIESLVVGTKTITDGAKILEEEERQSIPEAERKPESKAKQAMAIGISVLISLAIFVAVFIWLPNWVTDLLKPYFTTSHAAGTSILLNLIDGVLRLIIFIGYMLVVALLKDIKRVYMYHGAEHKVIHCFESGKELTVENARSFKTLHPRCGTSYLFLVMVVAILLFSLLGWSENLLWRVGSRILLLPIVAGLAYELLRVAAKSNSIFMRIIRAPGMALQNLTTRKPEDDMIEVAIAAFNACAEMTKSLSDVEKDNKKEEIKGCETGR